MRLVSTPLAGLFVVELEYMEDARGHFVRTWCRDQFAAWDLDPTIAQCSLSFNRRAGTVRGLHFQAPPHQESKLVRCARGAIFDIAVDLREGSETYLQWWGMELSDRNGKSLFIPKGFAHGFETLMDDCEVAYQISARYEPSAARGLRWDDPRLAIVWPRDVTVISERDRSWPLLT